MTLNSKWKQNYNRLREYMQSNSEIKIDINEVSIPEHLRDGFYEIFDEVRNGVVNARFAELPLEVKTLESNYIQVEKELKGLLGIERIDLPVDLSSFLHNPKESLSRGIFHRLFELVQGKISEEDFTQMAENDLSATAWGMFCLGYEAWAALSLMRLLDPDEAFRVELNEDDEPFVAKLKEIAFGRQFHHTARRVPEIILHSKKIDRYVAFKAPLQKEVDGYYIPHEPQIKIKNVTGDTSSVLGSRVLFFSIVSDLKKIPVFANLHDRTINGPDLLVEFLAEPDMDDVDTVSQIQRRVEIMKPRRGGCIVIMNQKTGPDIKKPGENVDICSAGLDSRALMPVIEKLE